MPPSRWTTTVHFLPLSKDGVVAIGKFKDTELRNLVRRILFVLGASVISLHSPAQSQSPASRSIRSYELTTHTGFIFAHSEDVQNTKGAKPKGLELSMTWQKNDERTWNLCNCFPQHGLMLAYYDFDNAVLGKGLQAAYILEPWYKINNNNFASLKSAAGVAYLSNPYDPVKNPANRSYSTTISAYLFVGIGWWRRITDALWVAPHIQYQHTSNGGLTLPNKGINWPTASLTFSYRPRPSPLKTFPRSAWQGGKLTRWDFGFFGIANREGGKPDEKSDRFLVAGIVLQHVIQIGRINNLSAGIEFNYDGKVGSRMQRDDTPGEPLHAGVLVGHEFILGRFLFSQRIGMYLHQAGNYFPPFFHRWGLAYRFNHHWSAGINLKAHRQVADYADIRIVYSLSKPGT